MPNGTACRNCSQRIHSLLAARLIISDMTRQPIADDLAELLASHHRRLHGAAGPPADDDVGAGDRGDGNPQVAVQDEECEQQDERAQRGLRAQARHEDAPIADGAEPEPLHEEVDEVRQDDKGNERYQR